MPFSTSKSEMTADDVCGFLALMDALDACLGSQTRRHGDLDMQPANGRSAQIAYHPELSE
jgi:hypothetical protein